MKKHHWIQTITAALLAMLLCPVSVRAAASATVERADKLVSLHLFRGTGVTEDGERVYDLDATPTRLQGLIMLVRLLGAEEEALRLGNATPFTDVSYNSAGYVSYAYRQGITKGTTSTTFTPGTALTARTYITFLLRTLGYSEEEGDFLWGEQTDLAASLGILTEEEARALAFSTLTRGDMVDLSYATLTCTLKGEARTLAEKLRDEDVFTQEEGEQADVLRDRSGEQEEETPPDNHPAAHETDDGTKTVDYAKTILSTSEGDMTAYVLRINTANPRVRVKAAHVDAALGHTASFSRIVEDAGEPLAVLNANFFSSGSVFKTPIGHLMVEGKFLYANSGLSSLGIRADGQIEIGRPAVFTRLRAGEDEWSAYEINTAEQAESGSVLYTPAYGERVSIQNDGWILLVENDVIAEFYSVVSGASVTIPPGGCAVYMGTGYATTPYFRIPQKGAGISMEYYLRVEDEEGFTLEGVESIVSGAPRLLKGGELETGLEEGFTGTRFTTLSTPRTAAGIDRDGQLVLVSVPDGATIPAMREAMRMLGCVDAFNLDGGASCALYYDGAFLALPTRELTSTLQVFVDG